MAPPLHIFESFEDMDSSSEESKLYSTPAIDEVSLSLMSLYYAVFLVSLFAAWFLVYCCFRFLFFRQKTREPQQRRMYMGSRVQPSMSQQTPTIYVSPSNLPPPPKYEAMAPPSYEEVCGIHYPNYPHPISTQSIAIQPIAQPIVAAVALSTNQQSSPSRSAAGSNNQSTAANDQSTTSNDQSPPPFSQVASSAQENRLSQESSSSSPTTVVTVNTDCRSTSVTVASQ